MNDQPIQCMICNAATHSIALHLHEKHQDTTLDAYKAAYPDAPLLSELAQKRIADSKAAKQPAIVDALSENFVARKASIQSLFKVNLTTSSGDPLEVTKFEAPSSLVDLVPEVDSSHVWGDGEDLRHVLMALETNMPLYVFGHKGTGKTTDITQVCAVTGRPMIRVQHTRSTEEYHIIGQMTVVGGETRFELGPLAVAMREGLVYLADEYDVAQPGALAVYQPVLEGQPLVIKEAPRHLRVIKPHPMFRFCATGNTNGTGDETGLYAGTMLQNSANYDRFQMAIQKSYMDAKHETSIVVGRTGLRKEDAAKLVGMANEVRKQFDAGKMNDTVSTRSLVSIATIGRRRANMKVGITLGWSNKLNVEDRQTVQGIAQRIWG